MNHSLLPCFDDCLRHEAAEWYAMGELSAFSSERYEGHLLLCPQCQDALAQFDAFVAAMRGALARLKPDRAASASC